MLLLSVQRDWKVLLIDICCLVFSLILYYKLFDVWFVFFFIDKMLLSLWEIFHGDYPHIYIAEILSSGRFDGVAPEPREGIQRGHIPGSKCIPFFQVQHLVLSIFLRIPQKITCALRDKTPPTHIYIVQCKNHLK